MRLASLTCLLLLAWGAAGATGADQVSRTQLGVLGEPTRFASLTGQRSAIRHSFIGWHQPNTLPKLLDRLKPLPMVAIKTGGIVTPLGIAQGKGDGFLLELNRVLAGFGAGRLRPADAGDERALERVLRVQPRRLLARAAATRPPRSAGAFARIALMSRGGPAGKLNAKLRKLGQPGVSGRPAGDEGEDGLEPAGLRRTRTSQANSAQAYYPGDAYVDVVANDLYDQGFKAAWDANEALYAAHRNKPFGIAEWGLWAIDDPAFVERMAAFVKSHRRIEFLVYFSGRPGSIWDLASKPRSRAAYRRVITPLG